MKTQDGTWYLVYGWPQAEPSLAVPTPMTEEELTAHCNLVAQLNSSIKVQSFIDDLADRVLAARYQKALDREIASHKAGFTEEVT